MAVWLMMPMYGGITYDAHVWRYLMPVDGGIAHDAHV